MNKSPAVIINGDDFGYSENVNRGIIRAYEEGILTSTTAFGNCLKGDEAISQLQNLSGLTKPPLGIGAHLNLTFGKPCMPQLFSQSEFVRPFKSLNSSLQWENTTWKNFVAQFLEKTIEEEFLVQIQHVRSILGECDHIDSHHAIAGYYPAFSAYEKIAQDTKLPVRIVSHFSEPGVIGGEFVVEDTYSQDARKKGIKTTDSLDMTIYSREKDPIEAFCKVLATVKPGEVREFMFHPTIDDSQGAWRKIDLDILISPRILQTVSDLGIILTTYNESVR